MTASEGIALFGVSAAVIGGVTNVCYQPPHHAPHWFAASLVWGLGAVLIGIIVYLVSVLWAVAECIVIEAGDDIALDAMATLDPGCAESDAVKLWAALTPWQTGIGAGVGLLGLAWATMYRSIYEDWIKHQPLPPPEDARTHRQDARRDAG